MTQAMTEPGSKLLVYGPRRMGKTSAILNAIESIQSKGGHAFLADLSTSSTAVDMGNRILGDSIYFIRFGYPHRLRKALRILGWIILLYFSMGNI